MGLKFGMAAWAADEGLYVPLKINDGKPYPLARVIVVWQDNQIQYALRYPNGVIGHLALTEERQLEPYFFEFADPTVPLSEEDELAMADKLPSSSFIFNRTYEAKDIPGHELV